MIHITILEHFMDYYEKGGAEQIEWKNNKKLKSL